MAADVFCWPPFLRIGRMADVKILGRFILSFEGGFSNHPYDKGGPTNKGVTLSTWMSQGYDKDGDGDIDIDDLRMITDDDALRILKKNYWDRWRADEIKDQGIANLLVDWTWCSGSYGIKIPQRVLGVTVDGVVGPKTIAAVNGTDAHRLFDSLHKERMEYLERICQITPTNRVHLNGWIRRLNAIKYRSITLNTNPILEIRF